MLQANLISHAVLPGLALSVAFGFDPALGGVISGILGSLLAERLQRSSKLNEEAVINTVLAGFLGLGVLLIPLLGLRLDLEALLFGDLLVQTWLPRSWLLALGSGPTVSVLALMLLALVVSVCSSVDAFLALGFAAQVTPGALLAFLLLGPVVDLKLAGLFTVLLSTRAIAITAVAASLLVLLIGQWVNLVLL